jgi:RimJ/RimL family protein N-acetyltransferase
VDHNLNTLGQPVGRPLPDWSPPPHPPHTPLVGRFCRVEPLAVARHAAELHAANQADAEGRMWTYLPYGPFADLEAYQAWMAPLCAGADPLFFAIVETASGRALGVASYLRITPAAGSIEVGHLAFAPPLQRTPAATEAMALMMGHAFALGYRRYEWKCNALNASSRTAAQRLGLSFEGVFRQAAVVKGRSRDTAWYAAIDLEWPALESAFARWLDPANFDAAGRQRTSLATLTGPLLHRRG